MLPSSAVTSERSKDPAPEAFRPAGGTASTLDESALQAIVDDPLSLELRDDLEQIVPELPTPIIVELARQLRGEGRLELVLPHASAEQIHGILDLDAWERERFHHLRGREWLHSIVECYHLAERPRGALSQLIDVMDRELWTLGTMAATAVAELAPDDDEHRQQVLEDMASLLTFESPSGFYVVGVPDDELGRMTLRIIASLYDDNLEEGDRLVRSIKWELASQLEDEASRWRRGRLADLGFPEWEEAMQLFVPLSRDAVMDEEQTAPRFGEQQRLHRPPTWSTGGALFRRVMSRLEPGEHGERAREFMLLVNELMAAQRFEPGDSGLQERAVQQAQGCLTIAFELIIAGQELPDPEALLAARVASAGLRKLFRFGYGALAKLRKAALTLHKTGQVSIDETGSLLDRPWDRCLSHLSAWCPELPLESTANQTRPLHSLADVAFATARIAQAAALTRLTFDSQGYAFDPIWITRADEAGRLKLGDLIRTALVHRQLPGSAPAPAPLSPADIRWARENLLENGTVTAEVRQDLLAHCKAVGADDHGETFAENLLTRIAVELLAIEDPSDEQQLARVGGFFTIQQIGVWLKTSV